MNKRARSYLIGAATKFKKASGKTIFQKRYSAQGK